MENSTHTLPIPNEATYPSTEDLHPTVVTLDTDGNPLSQQPGGPVAIIIAQGKLLDFIDGVTQREETPEEYVRQEIAKSLVREYRYQKKDIAVEFTLKLGSRKPRADLVIFPLGALHKQDDAYMLVECKNQSV